VDGSETGSANFFGPAATRVFFLPETGRLATHYDPPMHLRPPSIDPGITSFIWSFLLALFIWIGLLGIGVSQGTSLVVALVSFGAMFLFIRLQGGDDPVR
jgi:hypothetical protein